MITFTYLTGVVDAEKRRFKEKHSLDSDEEDEDEDKYNVLDDDNIEGKLYFLPPQQFLIENIGSLSQVGSF